MKKRSRFIGLCLTIMGALVLLNNVSKPQIEALNGSGVFGLVASGILFGIGVIGLIGILTVGSK